MVAFSGLIPTARATPAAKPERPIFEQNPSVRETQFHKMMARNEARLHNGQRNENSKALLEKKQEQDRNSSENGIFHRRDSDKPKSTAVVSESRNQTATGLQSFGDGQASSPASGAGALSQLTDDPSRSDVECCASMPHDDPDSNHVRLEHQPPAEEISVEYLQVQEPDDNLEIGSDQPSELHPMLPQFAGSEGLADAERQFKSGIARVFPEVALSSEEGVLSVSIDEGAAHAEITEAIRADLVSGSASSSIASLPIGWSIAANSIRQESNSAFFAARSKVFLSEIEWKSGSDSVMDVENHERFATAPDAEGAVNFSGLDVIQGFAASVPGALDSESDLSGMPLGNVSPRPDAGLLFQDPDALPQTLAQTLRTTQLLEMLKIVPQVTQGTSRDIIFHTEELGAVRLTIGWGAGLELHFSLDRSDTLTLFRNAATDLHAALSRLGVSDYSLSFSDQSSDEQADTQLKLSWSDKDLGDEAELYLEPNNQSADNVMDLRL
ncbi:MAG: flagellar hook-length control protein FliK [Roseinatronobacter sp.]